MLNIYILYNNKILNYSLQLFDEKELSKQKINLIYLSHTNKTNDKKSNNNFDIFLSNIEYIIKYFEEHNELNSNNSNNFSNWLSDESYLKLFHQYELFYDQIKQPLFRKRFLVQVLILFNSFINPINQYQKNIFSFSQNQKEKIYLLSKYCLDYLSKKYNLFINDLIQNENIWNKWKENNCPEISKKVQINNKSDLNINTKITEVKNLFKNYNTNYFMSLNNNFIDNIKTFKETKLEDIKFSESIEGLNSEVPFFGIYLEQIYKDLDPEEEEENTKERILNNMPSFSWKFLRLLSEGDINKINTEQVYKLLNISEEYYKTFAPKDAEIKFNFKVLTPPPKIELKPKEEISLPKDLLEQNINNNIDINVNGNNINNNNYNNRMINLDEAKDETSEEEETNKDKPVIRLPTEIIEKEKEKEKEKENINDRIIKNLSSDDNMITDLKLTAKKEEVREMIRLPSNLKIVEKNEEKVFNISNNNIEQTCEALPQIKEKEINNEKIIEKNENNNEINNNDKDKDIIKTPIKDIEKNKVVIKIDKNEIKNLNITNNNIKLDEEKKNELKSNDKPQPQIKQSKEESLNHNNNININNKQKSNLNINLIKHNNSIHKEKEKEIVSKDKENNNELNKSIKQQDSTIPAGIINISKDSKNASSINMETKNTKEEIKIIPKDSKNTINNTSNKEQHNKNVLNNRISNSSINLKESNNKINNKISQEIKNENNNNYHNTRSKVFSDRKSPDKKNILNNLSSNNKISSNGNISNRMNSNLSLNNNRSEINNNNNNRYDNNKYENKYSNKYDNNKNDNKYDNKFDNKYDNNKYDNKYNNKYENKYSEKYSNKYDNNKYDYKNDNNYNDRYDNNRYRYDNNYNNNNHYDNNRYRYDNKSYERNQEKDNPYLNKKRYNDDKYDNYMNSNKKRK